MNPGVGEDAIAELLEVVPEELTELLELEQECIAKEEKEKRKLQEKKENPQENPQ